MSDFFVYTKFLTKENRKWISKHCTWSKFLQNNDKAEGKKWGNTLTWVKHHQTSTYWWL
jgi:hypothetical protein